MNIDCQWIDTNLEALFNGTLSPEEQDRAHDHIENCGQCGKEVAALNAIDPIVRNYFANEMNRVRRATPRRVAKGRVVALSSAAIMVVSLLLIVTLRTPAPNSSSTSKPAISLGTFFLTANRKPSNTIFL